MGDWEAVFIGENPDSPCTMLNSTLVVLFCMNFVQVIVLISSSLAIQR